MVPRHETKADLALRTLRERILTGELPPGGKLDINRLAVEFDMSPTPIREALRVLQSDRLVNYFPHRGTAVASLSERDLAQIFELRMLLEPAAVKAAVRMLDDVQLSELERLHVEMVQSADESTATFSERNAAWHWMLYNAAASPYLADFIRRLWDAFPWRAIASVGGRPEAAVAEHEAIMDAVRRRAAAAAAALMRAHITSSGDALRLPGEGMSQSMDHATAVALVASAPTPESLATGFSDSVEATVT